MSDLRPSGSVRPSGSLPTDDQAPSSNAPPSMRFSLPPPPREPSFFEFYRSRVSRFAEHVGDVVLLSSRTAKSLVRRPLELRSTLQQLDSLGLKSMGIVAVTSIFVGMVMTIQFAFSLRRFGLVESIPRVVILAFCRELAPTLTAVFVGGRIGSGMAAEVGAMNVTEQVDAIRALGADPAKKLVLPRVLAATLVMPLLAVYALAFGTAGAIFVCATQYDISPSLFLRSSLEVVRLGDFFAGVAKTPFFGFLIAIIGCHFGLRTTGGTEGVGLATTRTVVAVSIAILIADFFLTKIFMLFQAT
jgi:phospholipid/cholesterol/gamma-HCH transport system permease protein